MRYLSVCSGIESATVARHPLGWTAAGFAEIDKFASAVLAERFGSNMPGEPLTKNGVPNFGDFTAIDLDQIGTVDLLVGGTPCQAFSFAGKRQSLADVRGNLTLAYVVLAHELARSHGLRNALYENVPGILSTDDNAFGCFLGALVGADAPIDLPEGVGRWTDAGMVAGPRARVAWRILDAQYFGLAQRRERVFVVADFGAGADPVQILFESKSLQGNPSPRREAGQRPARTLSARTEGGGGLGTDFDLDDGLVAFGGNNCSGPVDVAAALQAHGGPTGRQDFASETFIAFSCKDHGADAGSIAPTLRAMGHADSHANAGGQIAVAHTLRGEGFDASEDGTGRGVPLVPVAYSFHENQRGEVTLSETSGALKIGGGKPGQGYPAVAYAIQAGALRENPDSGPDGVGVQSDHAYTLEARAEVQAVAYDLRGREGGAQFEGPHDTANIRAASGGSSRSYVQQGWAVRRLTTTECARLQGFPDDHSRIPWRGKPAEQCPDGPQYKTYGNSMATKCMCWIGERFDVAFKAARES